MKNVTQWTSKIKKLAAGTLLVVSISNVDAGILSILKHGNPDGQGAPAVAEQETVNEWQRVAFVGSAKVKKVSGTVEYLSGVEKWSPLSAGKTLHPGDVLRTQDDSRVIVQMTASGSLISVTPKTVMRLTEFEKGWDQSILTGVEDSTGYSVRSLRGSAEYLEAKTWKVLTVNSVVPSGTRIRTSNDTTMDLFHVKTGAFLRINPKANLVLNPAASYSSSMVAVQTAPRLTGTATAQISR